MLILYMSQTIYDYGDEYTRYNALQKTTEQYRNLLLSKQKDYTQPQPQNLSSLSDTLETLLEPAQVEIVIENTRNELMQKKQEIEKIDGITPDQLEKQLIDLSNTYLVRWNKIYQNTLASKKIPSD